MSGSKRKIIDEHEEKDRIWGRSIENEEEYQKLREIGQTIRDLRKRRGEDQDTFGHTFARYIGRTKAYKRSTVSGWEKGILPQKDTLRQMCDFLGVPYSALDCDENNGYTPFNIDEIDKVFNILRSHYHLPVWCEFNEKTHEGAWAIVDATQNRLIFSSSHQVPFEKIDFKIYETPIKNIIPSESRLEPLSNDDKHDTVWIEPMRTGYIKRHLAMEWAIDNPKLKAYVSESGTIYPYSENKKTYLCYRDL